MTFTDTEAMTLYVKGLIQGHIFDLKNMPFVEEVVMSPSEGNGYDIAKVLTVKLYGGTEVRFITEIADPSREPIYKVCKHCARPIYNDAVGGERPVWMTSDEQIDCLPGLGLGGRHMPQEES